MAEVEDGGTPTRRMKQNEETVPTVTLVLRSFVSQTIPTHETSSLDSEYPGEMIPLDSPPTFMPLRQTSRDNVGCLLDRYDFSHDIA
jgi:hypothetical protein